MEIFGQIICGIGLIFFGIRFLSIYLKNSASLSFKEKFGVLSKNPGFGFLFGCFFSVISQSSVAAVLMLICTLKAGIIKLKHCFPVIVGINVFGAIAVFILAFKIEVVVYFLLGITAILFTSGLFYKHRNLLGVLVGVGLLFLGLYTIQNAASVVHSLPAFNGAILYVNKSYMLGFLIGALLCIICQSSLIIQAIIMVLYMEGLLTIDSSLMLLYGAFLGSSVLTLVLSFNIFGESKQLAMFQVLYNVIGSIITVPIIYLEIYKIVPTIGALINFTFANKGFQIASATFIFDVIAGVAMLCIIPQLRNLFNKLFPETIDEKISKPYYLFSNYSLDVDTASDLIALEQSRLIDGNVHMLTMVKEGKSQLSIEALIDGVSDLAKTVREYLVSLPNKYQVNSSVCYRFGLLFDIQNNIDSLIDSMKQLTKILLEKEFFSEKRMYLYYAITEGLDTLLIATSDVLHDKETPYAEYYNN